MAAPAKATLIENGNVNSGIRHHGLNGEIPMATATLYPPLANEGGAAVGTGVPVNGSGVAVGTGVPVFAGTNPLVLPPVGQGTQLTKTQLQRLNSEGFPNGLARELAGMISQFPIRYWIVDNSGSMWENDGRSLRILKGLTRVVPCTRWVEIRGAVDYHAKTAALMEAWTTFRLLNDPGRHIGPQEFSIAKYDDRKLPSSNSVMKDLQIAETTMRKSQPQGATPLTQHVVEISEQIRPVAEELRSRGQKVVVVIATDGLPSDRSENSTYATQQAFIQALDSLRSLPVWLVIRLCTKDKDILKFYNELDQKLEIELEVLVDLFEESEEVCGNNPWLNYGLPLHRCREMGYHHRLFDLLDERPLNKDEVKQFLEILFGKDQFGNAPNPHSDWKAFLNFTSKALKKEEKTYNPLSEKMEPWINVKVLEKSFRQRSARSFLFGNRRKLKNAHEYH